MKSSSYDVANTVCGKQKLSAFLRVESSVLFEFYIAFASKLGGATGLNRIVKGC